MSGLEDIIKREQMCLQREAKLDNLEQRLRILEVSVRNDSYNDLLAKYNELEIMVNAAAKELGINITEIFSSQKIEDDKIKQKEEELQLAWIGNTSTKESEHGDKSLTDDIKSLTMRCNRIKDEHVKRIKGQVQSQLKVFEASQPAKKTAARVKK